MDVGFSFPEAEGAYVGQREMCGQKDWILPEVGALRASFHKNAWTLEGAKANKIVLQGNGKSWEGELRAEKKEETENIPKRKWTKFRNRRRRVKDEIDG